MTVMCCPAVERAFLRLGKRGKRGKREMMERRVHRQREQGFTGRWREQR